MKELFSNQRYSFVPYVIAGYLVIVLGAMFFISNDASAIQVINILSPICALIALITVFVVSSRSGQTVNSRRVWLWMAAGFLAWTIAVLIWFFYFRSNGSTGPYPGLADIFWLVGYIMLIEALIVHYRSSHSGISENRAVIIALAILVILLSSGYFVTLPILRTQDQQHLLQLYTHITYFICAIILLPIALLVLLAPGRGRLSAVWGMISTAFVVRAITDLVLAYLTWSPPFSGRMVAFPIIINHLVFLVLAAGIYGSWIIGQQTALSSRLKLGFVGQESEVPQFLINSDAEGKIVYVSKNFLQFSNNSLPERFIGKPVHEILGLTPQEFAEITNTCSRGGFVIQKDIKISAGHKIPVQLLLTAIGSIANNEYFGMDMILDLPEYSAQAFPLDPEAGAILKEILRRTGQQTKENSAFLAEYFVAHIRSFTSLISQRGGPNVAENMARDINSAAEKNNWPIRISGQDVNVEPGFDDFDDAELIRALPTLFEMARQHAMEVTTRGAVAEQVQKVDRLLDKKVLQAAQHFGLRHN